MVRSKKSGIAHKTRDGQFLWTYASVKNVLAEEAYTGVLVNHRREYLGGKARADLRSVTGFVTRISIRLSLKKQSGSKSRRG